MDRYYRKLSFCSVYLYDEIFIFLISCELVTLVQWPPLTLPHKCILYLYKLRKYAYILCVFIVAFRNPLGREALAV